MAKRRPLGAPLRRAPSDLSITLWLGAVYLMVLGMVVVGGITRLTGSGLSMVEWHPLMGAIPPTSEAAWLEVFGLYQQSPQYQQVNHWMTLQSFKDIFFWEYVHRLLGRTVGLVFFVPMVVFWVRGRLDARLKRRALIALCLGGSQGLLGWFMVKSGLVDIPEVSHLRLAAHLSLAFFVGMYVLWMILDLHPPRPEQRFSRVTAPPLSPAWPFALVALISIQVVYGAFMAGLKAGKLFSTFPDMNGTFFPSGSFALEPWAANLVDSPLFVHAFHRGLAWVCLVAACVFSVHGWRCARHPRQRRLAAAIGAATIVQVVLGAFVVVLHVPVAISVVHQVGAFVVLSLVVAAAHAAVRSRRGILV